MYIQDGVGIFKKPNSKKWHTYIKVKNNQAIRKTLDTDSIDVAKERAKEMYLKFATRQKQGISIKSLPFVEAVALTADERLQQANDGQISHGRVQGFEYCSKRWLVPFFEDYELADITALDIGKWIEWRKQQSFCTNATLKDNLIHLKAVFNWAVGQQQMKASEIPDFPKLTVVANPRTWFNKADQKKLMFSLESYVQRATQKNHRQLRTDLQEYVICLLATGCRPGEFFVGAKDLTEITVNGKKTYQVKVDVGTKGHNRNNIIMLPFAYPVLKNRIAKYGDAVYNDLWFRHKSFLRIWDNFTAWAGLKYNFEGKKHCLYSLRHTYATNMLTMGNISMHQLAKQMGTSVAMLEKHYSHVVPNLVAEKLVEYDDSNVVMLPHSTSLHKHFEFE